MKTLSLLLLVLSALPAHSAPRACTPEDLRAHLEKLKLLVAGCAAAKTAVACDPTAAGSDDDVELAGGTRLVEFEWLRLALASAPGSSTATADLEASAKRLDVELRELAAAAPPANISSESHSCAIQGVPRIVAEKGSTLGTVPCVHIHCPAAT